ncbi:PLP-dependent aminotransferase family protein [Halothiobacillus sp.]|uniref:MocR-like pyridoxine biosynthesis transcription factor PdxR n=1 Tax=Halothiobacillus sp. TaxID=1891311 RepID=UPI002AD20A70|nr:PLP-dependent aminotransferase family protein [Halothiobacillus sp.]
MESLTISDWLLAELKQGRFPPRMPSHRRVYESIRRAIANQHLTPGTRLPSTRSLAEALGLSRNTLLAAFEQLHEEGYVISQVGSGTRIARTLPENFMASNDADKPKGTDTAKNTVGLSKRGAIAAGQTDQPSYEVQPFSPGEDDFSAFPTQLWRRLLNRQWRDPQPAYLDYGHAGGHLPLRRAIANYLRMSRTVNLTVEQILITSGTQQSIDLCARLLTDHGDRVWVENPGYWGARRVLEVNGLELHPVPVDDEGMAPDNIDFRCPPRLIYTTPSHQYPKGVVMSYGRRRLLLDYAASRGAWILEDDYDSEFRFEGRPLSSLQGMDQSGCVLYMGTFSKVMYPGIKLGYIVVPPDLAESFKRGLYELQRPGQVVIQAALAEFIEEGHFSTHIRRLRQIYKERRQLLQKALAPVSRVGARLPPAGSGLHLVVELPPHCDDVRVAELAAEQGLRVYPLSYYGVGEKREKGLIVGYAYAATERITPYGRILADVIQAALSH